MIYYIPVLTSYLGGGSEHALYDLKFTSLEECLKMCGDFITHRPGLSRIRSIMIALYENDTDYTLIKTVSVKEAKRILKLEQL